MSKQDSAAVAGGGQMSKDPRWISTSILHADDWAKGSAFALLDSSAWRSFADRLARLSDRVSSADIPSDLDRTEGYRYVAMLIRNALDMAIEDYDPDRPKVVWRTRRSKFGWDCADALYGAAIIRGGAAYRVTGKRGTVRFLGFQLMSGLRTLHNTHADELKIARDGSFEIIVSPKKHPGNWIPLSPETDGLFIRQFFYDWDRETLASLWIERIDKGKRNSPSGVMDPGSFAKRLDAVAGNVEANLDLWLNVALAQKQHYLNKFPEVPFGSTHIGGQKHQTAGTCYFKIADDEALLIEVKPPKAKYWSLHLGNVWLESLDYANHQSSLNGHQARLDRDGLFRAVVSKRDPGVPNWLDTVGRNEGTIIYRWNLADSLPVPAAKLIKFDDVRRHLPKDTPRVAPALRAQAVERRRRHVLRRFARPL
ncbi:MAG: DUF1214 domain-containing protein [Chloroflexi bacterium]|nr:DUF1214 domain-containing protein [Chloroflexota bacterium]